MDEPAARARHRADLLAALPGHLERLGWDRGRVEAHQRARLRALLRHAIANAPFHARRLTGIDPGSIDLGDLHRLPTMTKADMMANLDEVVTDPRIDRATVEHHLAGTGHEPSYFLDEFLVLASGGSSGEMGAFVYSRAAAVDYTLGLVRAGIARLLDFGEPPPGGVSVGMVAAGAGIHASRALGAIFSGDLLNVTSIPVTLPLEEIVARLNALQPFLLQGYPSVLRLLAEEKNAGRLDIAPLSITGSSEQFPLETRRAVEEAFGVPAVDQFGSTEGVLGVSEPGDTPITLASDLAIVELVDDENRPVPVGTQSAKVLVTNLFNPTQPLIRYELTDRFVQQPFDAEYGHVRVTVDGRADDLLRYGSAEVHPLVFRSALTSAPEVIEYQVRQTPMGADVDVVASGPLDTGALAARLVLALGRAGVTAPRVEITKVQTIRRNPRTGKVKRFVALQAPGP